MNVKTSGSSAQDAGMADDSTDLNILASEEEQPKETEQETVENPEESEGEKTEKEAPEGKPKEEKEESSEGKESEEGESEEEPSEDEDKAEYLRQKQEKHAAKKIQEVTSELSEAKRRLEEYENLQERLVREDANHLYDLAEINPNLTDRLVEKIYGDSLGVETFSELKLLAEKDQADDRYKPLYDQQIKMMKELKEWRQYKDEWAAEKKERELTQFRTKHPDFYGVLQEQTMKLIEETGEKLTMERAYELTRALIAQKTPEELIKEGEDKAMIKMAKNKPGVRGGGEAKVKMGKGKTITQEQLNLAKRFGHDPSKVY